MREHHHVVSRPAAVAAAVSERQRQQFHFHNQLRACGMAQSNQDDMCHLPCVSEPLWGLVCLFWVFFQQQLMME